MTTTVATRSAPSVGDRAPRPSSVADGAWLVGFAGAIGAIVTVGLWIRHGEIGAATGPGGIATAAGQLTALLGTYAVLAQLVLMSRIAPLERAIGFDRLAVWHRWNGFATVWLLVAHVVLTTLGYAQGDHLSLWAQTTDFVSHYADVLMAWIGTVMFFAVAFTSVRLARKKLKRETWYFIHLYAYLAIALTFAHQLAVGSDFSSDPAARIWWVGLFVVTFGAIAWWRVAQPILLNQRLLLRVHSVQPEGPGVVSINLSGRALDRIGAQPGQFFLWRFLTRHGWWQAHPFSLSAAPTARRLRITVKDLGDHTHRLQRLKRGTRVMVEGPFGTFTAAKRTRRKALFIAGGIGITPLRAMLDTVRAHDDVIVLYRVARPEDAIFTEELQRIAKERGVVVQLITGTEIGDDHTDLLGIPALRRGVPDIATRDCFVCGPPALVNAVHPRLVTLGVPSGQIHFERFEL
jgi:predicted ferric reductase